ncbi:VOC family protein [Catenulispora sp. NF23]|uniref:VOC family protein n=1 Tax=Catenulispora pinistramenti TaxID=2705254 RepID=A0ABS5L6V5_9ACTN|nr:VOC family protein [Catenulispora pinistramenti]MBS2538571.1 VOC family protein [Catenulispora pinistramenti]MBS2553960.1 VOC family protein [Catenulispora pinistramenti]
MTPIARLAGVSLDTDDPRGLASFYQRLLGLEVFLDSDDVVALKGAGFLLTAQRVRGHVPPDWPSGPTPKQMHLDIAVADLEGAESLALSLGATRAAYQPLPDEWRVLIDPAGHPFCLTTQAPMDLG